ncbi:MAG: hypothetical protein AUK48_15605 [Oscillatoriales cyanobacterium CG2_30_44_21]|nr:MAG: hypothetical protein AUK48_15605 [Oscillatoriales cyanobacterium CG2_30_44_21]
MNLNDINKDQSSFLDFLRGAASIFVMIHHVKNSFFTSYTSLDSTYSSNLFVSIFYFFTGFGRLPVLLFFVLSGFFISRSILRLVKKDNWSWKGYLIDRLVRLEIVLIPALFLTLFWDTISQILIENYQLVKISGGNISPVNFVGNVLFLQTIFFDNYGSNYPLWSLSNEFWYYILFPLLLFLVIGRKREKAFLFITFSIILVILTIKNLLILKYFSIWMLGVIPIFTPIPKKSYFISILSKHYKIISSTLLLLILFAFRKNFLDDFWGEILVSSLFSFVIYLTLLSSHTNVAKSESFPLFEFISAKISGFSYTLYLVHTPIINFLTYISTLIGFGVKWLPSSDRILYHFFMSILIIFYAFAVSEITEKNTSKARNFINSILRFN